MNPYAFGGLCGTFIIESPTPPAETAFGWSTYHNTTVDDAVGSATSFGDLPGPRAEATFEITEISYSPASNTVSLTWNSEPGESFGVDASIDLSEWNIELDDNVAASAGETTTASFDLSFFGLEAEEALFFKARKT
jgi:hypothetical protein|tara:strand:+ start:528 stop:935 length:408 start_codon:yes stop_codon:yes gene_type:complete